MPNERRRELLLLGSRRTGGYRRNRPKDGRAFATQTDVGNRTDVRTTANHVHDEFGSIDVLVNNAGVTIDKRFDQMTWEDWYRVLEVNLGGTFHCTKAFYEDIKSAE